MVNVASPDFSEMVGVPFWELPFNHISNCLDIGPRSDYVTTALAARTMMIEQGSGVVINISSHGAETYLLSVPYGVGKAAIDRVTRDTAFELRPHGIAVVSLWPGLVLTEGLLANTVETEDGRRELHGLDISFGETPKFNGLAVVALAADPAIMERTGGSFWSASLAREYGFTEDDGHLPPEMANTVLTSMGDDMPDYWRGVERGACVSEDGVSGCPHFPTITAQGLDPDPLLAELRTTEPVVRVQLPFGEPLWMLTRYEDVRAMLADPRFSRTATIGTDVGRMAEFFPIEDSILGMDPPGHTRIRRLVSGIFTARRMQALRGRAQEIVDGLLDAMEQAEQPVDFVQAVALPLPITMICELLGVPFEDRQRFNGWADIFMTSSGHTVEELLDAHGQLTAYLADLIAKRRVEPTDDILGALVSARDEDPSVITEGELQSLLMAILVAGYETTANQLGKFVLCLLERPDQLQILRAQPELMANAVEELMRFVPLSAGSQLAYLATEDVEVGGVLIRAGEGVMPSTASANRDESVFPHADQIDVERTDIFQLGFGHGSHYCLGAHLARVELQVALTSLFARFPDLRLADGVDAVRWKDGSAVWGLEFLRLCF